MFGSTFPIWGLILVLCGLLLFFLSIINPHIDDEDKRRLSQSNRQANISIKYHFSEMVQLFLAFLTPNVALILFFVEDFKGLAAHLWGGGFWVKVLVVVLAILCTVIIEVFFMLASLLIEKIRVLSICRIIKKRYGVEVSYDFP